MNNLMTSELIKHEDVHITNLVLGFPGVGKTVFFEKYKVERMKWEKTERKSLGPAVIVDSDSSGFKWINRKGGQREVNPDFPDNYIHNIRKRIEEENTDFIFISTHQEVRNAVEGMVKDIRAEGKYHVQMFIVIPSEYCYEEYLTRYRRRHTGINSTEFVNMMTSQYMTFVNEIKDQYVVDSLMSSSIMEVLKSGKGMDENPSIAFRPADCVFDKGINIYEAYMISTNKNSGRTKEIEHPAYRLIILGGYRYLSDFLTAEFDQDFIITRREENN